MMIRTFALLVLTLLGGATGFFAGSYSYNFCHPIPLGGLQVAVRDVGQSLERHLDRQNWLLGGAIIGSGVGFVGTVLASRVGQAAKTRQRAHSDIDP
ncbi:MAG: hypothetical protein ACP5XB_29105 [Isosphaeraceae bacterium]